MPDLKETLTTGLKAGLIALVLMSLTLPGFADVMHFENGKVVQGKLYRVTGDIIEFRENNGFGNKMQIHRIELTNRRDIVETWGEKRFFGEIVYLDKFKLDLKTQTGMVKLNRLKITNVVVGTPAEQPVSRTDVMPLAPQADQGNMRNEPLPGHSSDTEDWDAIPAVNRY